MTDVCQACGAAVAPSRTGRLVHIEEIPKGVDPDHEIVAVVARDRRAELEEADGIRSAIDDMLQHHSSLCPWSSCEFTKRLADAAGRLRA